jgi:signal transduction histidine kinase
VEKAIKYFKMIQIEEDYKHLLEEYNQEIETLVAERTMSLMALTIADKIRNPATVIGLTCKRLLDKEEDPDILKVKLNDIMHEAEKLDELVTKFESLLSSKRSMFEYEDVNEHIASVIAINRSNAESKGVEIILSTSEYPLNINMQKHLFQSALSHLIKNSIEATPEGGSITVSAYKDENNAILTISDTGHGINKEDLDKIFDPMYSTKTQRFGMGLSLVKQIVLEHMGEIDVESRIGEGTTFRIKLPLRWKENTL